jgi:iduronate 2-sulfatase
MTTRRFVWQFGKALILLFLCSAPAFPAEQKLNVLFIAVDDLRPQMGCYGDAHAKTPNIDRLARSGVIFDRAYCQQAVCSPSRTSLLTGRRPDTTKVYDLQTHFRKTIPDAVTLPQHFKANGWHTQGLSKIFHGGLDDALSWSVPHETPKKPGQGPDGQKLLAKLRQEARDKGLDLTKRANQPRGLPYEAPDVADDELADGWTANRAVELLGQLKDRPFFLAVGFLKPHLPFIAPKKYWDLYDRDKLPKADNPYPPKGSPSYALNDFGELRAYYGMPKKGPVSAEQERELVHGYYACMSYLDSSVGKLLAALEKNGLADKTVVVLWGDHGWQLGEHGIWCKHNNYETATRVPLLVHVPGKRGNGKRSAALVEFVDIYPTLANLCGVDLPAELEGTNFAPLLDDPQRTWKAAAFSQYPRQIPGQGRGMGYAMRTERYRLVEWRVEGKDFREYELYDHQIDPGENQNLANDAGQRELLGRLKDQLHAGWKGVRPKS